MSESVRVLVVEDDPGDAFLIEELLVETGGAYEITLARTLGEALGGVADTDCVLLDMTLPDVSGVDAIRELNRVGNQPALVVMTGWTRYTSSELNDVGADDSVMKGELDGFGLARSIKYAMSRKRERRLEERLRRQQSPVRTGGQRGRLPDPQASSAILIGAADYIDDGLHDVPGVAHNVHDLARILAGPATGGFLPDRIHRFLNPTFEVGDALAAIAETARDVLFIYFAGHGLIDNEGELYLALSTSRGTRPKYTALPYSWIRSAMLDSPAVARVVVLDCCFSGRAIEVMADLDAAVAGQLQVGGAYTLTATEPNRLAKAPLGQRNTAFTGELLKLLRDGLDTVDEFLCVSQLYDPLVRAMLAANLARPQQRGTDTIGNLALTRNPAYLGSSPVG